MELQLVETKKRKELTHCAIVVSIKSIIAREREYPTWLQYCVYNPLRGYHSWLYYNLYLILEGQCSTHSSSKKTPSLSRFDNTAMAVVGREYNND